MYPKLFAFLLRFFCLTGCTFVSEQDIQIPQQNILPATPVPSPVDDNQLPGIGGISLGDSSEKVSNVLGSDYDSISIEEGGYFGEAYDQRTYQNGMRIIIGKKTNKVLQIISTALTAPTEQGIRIGDSAVSVLEKYRNKYNEPVSQHGSGQLEGWFEVQDGQLMIFDFNATDETMVNQTITKDAKVERIILAYSKFMD